MVTGVAVVTGEITGLVVRRESFRKLGVAGPLRRLKQHRSHPAEDLPVAGQIINITIGNAAAQVGVNILQVLRLRAINVAREVQIEVVGLNLRHWHQARVLGDFRLPGKGVDDLVKVLGAQPVLVAILNETLD